MYGVVSAMFSSEGRRRRCPSAALSTAAVAPIFANNEATAKKWRGCDGEVVQCLSRQPELQVFQKRFMS
jgi:hypothetical protein